MNELEGMINGLLSNPDEMKKIMNIASSVMGGADGAPSQGDSPSPPIKLPDLGGGIGNILGGLSSLPPGLGAAARKFLREPVKTSGDKAALFAALSPFLSDRRRNKLDRAVQLAKMMNVGLAVFGKNGGKK